MNRSSYRGTTGKSWEAKIVGLVCQPHFHFQLVLERVHYFHVVKNLVISNGVIRLLQIKTADTAHTRIDASVTRPFAQFLVGPRDKAMLLQ